MQPTATIIHNLIGFELELGFAHIESEFGLWGRLLDCDYGQGKDSIGLYSWALNVCVA